MIDVELGCMKSGKSKRLIDKVKEHDRDKKYLILKPAVDSRDGAKLTSRGCTETFDAVMIDENNEQLLQLLFRGLNSFYTIFVDEVQFFSKEFIKKLMDYCYTHDVDLVVCGLLFDFKGNPFPTSDMILEHADHLVVLPGKCNDCGEVGNIDILLDTNTGKRVMGGDSVLVENSTNRYVYKTVCPNCNERLKK